MVIRGDFVVPQEDSCDDEEPVDVEEIVEYGSHLTAESLVVRKLGLNQLDCREVSMGI